MYTASFSARFWLFLLTDSECHTKNIPSELFSFNQRKNMLTFDWNVQRSIKLDLELYLELYRFYWRAITLFYSKNNFCVFCIKFWFKFVFIYHRQSRFINYLITLECPFLSTVHLTVYMAHYVLVMIQFFHLFIWLQWSWKKLHFILKIYLVTKLSVNLKRFWILKKNVQTKKYCWQNWKLFIKTKKK